jgi:glycosyltransferase involved in cell wall biosynthesis
MQHPKRKLLHITAGAAGMYCGSCIRDNALASQLMSMGHDVILVPFYTPPLTDEESVSEQKVFFGGISVYLEQHVPLFRKTPWLLDRLWDSRFALKLASKSSLQVEPAALGELTVSMLRGEEGNQSKELNKLISWLASEPEPDIINLPYTLLISLAEPLKRALRRPVVCTLQGEDIFLDGLQEPYRSESLSLIKSNIPSVDAFMAVSDYYAAYMIDYLGIEPERMHVVPLGINLEGHSHENRPRSEVFTVGFFTRVAPEKGLHLLAEAYRRLRERGELPESRLEVAGYLAPEHKAYLQGIEEQMKVWGLGSEFNYRGVLDREQKIKFFQSMNVLSVPATYNDPKGIFLLEAMANGTPVVQPRRGTLTEIVERTGGGLLYEPDDIDGLAECLLAIYKDTARAEEMGRNGAEAVRQLYSAEVMAERALDVYARVLEDAPARQIEVV